MLLSDNRVFGGLKPIIVKFIYSCSKTDSKELAKKKCRPTLLMLSTKYSTNWFTRALPPELLSLPNLQMVCQSSLVFLQLSNISHLWFSALLLLIIELHREI